jgi:hypothetical protein
MNCIKTVFENLWIFTKMKSNCNFFIHRGRILTQSRKTPWISVRYVGHVQTLEGLSATSALTAIMGGDSSAAIAQNYEKEPLRN